MKGNQLKIVIFLAFIAAVGAVLTLRSRHSGIKNSDFAARPHSIEPCPGKIVESTMQDGQLPGLLEKGARFNVILNYYACNPVQRDDLVLFRYHTEQEPIVRIARGVAGDSFELKKVKDGWQLEINDSPVKSNRGVLSFGDPTALPPLGLAVKPRDGKVGKGEVILMSTLAPGHLDSTTMGMISVADVIGKVMIQKGENPNAQHQ